MSCINCKCITCGWCRCKTPVGVELTTHASQVSPSKIYVIGSMKNPRVPEVAAWLRGLGYDAFDDWYSPGPECDDKWQAYEKARGRTFAEALAGHHAKHVFALDKKHLDESAACVLVAPAGKSGHLELGYMIGRGKPGFILLDGEPERFDVMYQFATGVHSLLESLAYALSTVLR